MKILNMVIPILMHFLTLKSKAQQFAPNWSFVSNVKQLCQPITSDITYDVKFPAVYRRINCLKFLTLSNQITFASASEFALHLEDYLMYDHHTLALWVSKSLCDLYFMVQWFCLISSRLFDAWVSYFQIMRECDPNFDLKVNISQHDLYFMV